MNTRFGCTILLFFQLIILMGQNPSMVMDMNLETKWVGSNPDHAIVYNNKLYFQAADGIHGIELWVYDGINYPSMIMDIYPGSSNSNPKNFIVYNNKLFFYAYDSSGSDFWVIDGANEPRRLKDIHPGDYMAYGAYNEFGVVFSDKLYFYAENSSHGNSIWIYDGINTPVIFKDFLSGYSPSYPTDLTVCNNKLFFTTYYERLWVYDGIGEPEVVKKVYDMDTIYPYSFHPGHLTSFKNKLYFGARTDTTGAELWEYDGTDVRLVKDINVGNGHSIPRTLTVFENKVYFMADDGIHGSELWEYDGIHEPEMVDDINPGSDGLNDVEFLTYKDKLTFIALINGERRKLWAYDGINKPGIFLDTTLVLSKILAVYNEKIYLNANDGVHGSELMEYDGINPPVLIKDIQKGNSGSYPSDYVIFHDTLYYIANDQICSYDGYSDPLLWDELFENLTLKRLDNLMVYKDKLVFTATDGIHGHEIWEYDGKTRPEMIADRFPVEYGYAASFTLFNNQLYFDADDSNSYSQLWVYNGIDKPEMVPASYTYIGFNTPKVVWNNNMYFSAYDEDYGRELWVFDGINEPRMVFDISTESNSSSYPGRITPFKNKLYFTAKKDDYPTYLGDELWEYDGINHPQLAFDMVPGSGSPSPRELKVFGNNLYFTASIDSLGNEIWYYDGENFPKLLKDIMPGSGSSYPKNLYVFNNRLFFQARNEMHGAELWMYDGIADPVLVADINPGDANSEPDYLTAFQNKLYFTADNGFNGKELWVYCIESSSSITEKACNRYISPSGKIWTSSGKYIDTIPNFTGCDSIISIDLTVTESSYSELTVTSCFSFTSPGGKVWTESAVFTDTITNAVGCDSIIAFDLTITSLDTGVVQNENVLMASASSPTADYQWLDCNNGYSVIEGESNPDFSVAETGSYAIEITDSGCIDTSACYAVTLSSTSSNFESTLKTYPNPTQGELTIEMDAQYQDVIVIIQNIIGEIETIQTFGTAQKISTWIEGPKGMYFIRVYTENGKSACLKIVKE